VSDQQIEKEPPMTRTPLSTLLSFPFKDPAWFKKLLILALMIFLSSAIPIIPLIFVAGYMARLSRRMVVEKGAPTMPEWDDLGGIFRDGWRPFAVVFTYLLPVIAIFFIVWLVVFLPMMAIPSMWSGNGNQNLSPGEFMLFVTSNLVAIAGFGFAGLVSLLLTLFLPAAAIHSVVKEKYSSAFHLKEWWPVFAANLGGFFLAFVMTIVLNLAFGLVSMILFFTIILCCLLPFLTYGFSAYFYAVYAALCADAYRVGEDRALSSGKLKLEPPTPLGTPPSEALPEPAPSAEVEPEPDVESTPSVAPEAPASASEPMQTMVQMPAAKPESQPEGKPNPVADATLVQPLEPSAGSQTIIKPPSAEDASQADESK
jgi:hypothetical protein